MRESTASWPWSAFSKDDGSSIEALMTWTLDGKVAFDSGREMTVILRLVFCRKVGKTTSPTLPLAPIIARVLMSDIV